FSPRAEPFEPRKCSGGRHEPRPAGRAVAALLPDSTAQPQPPDAGAGALFREVGRGAAHRMHRALAAVFVRHGRRRPGNRMSSDVSAFNVADALEDISLLDILDHVLNAGVLLHGSLVISLAGVDLVYVGLNVVITSVETALRSLPERRKE